MPPGTGAGSTEIGLDRGLDGGNLLGEQQEASVLARDLAEEEGRETAAVAGAAPVELRQKAPGQRIGVADALGVQQRLDPVDVGAALLDQPFALTMPAFVVFFGRTRHARHAAHPWLAAAMREKHTHQLLDIDPIGLDPALAAIDLDARRIQHLVLDPLLPKPTMQPEAVIAGFVTRHDPHPRRTAIGCLQTRPPQQRRKRYRVAASQAMAVHLYRARHHQADLPARLAQFKRQVNRGILTRGGGRVSRGRLTHVILQGKRFRLAPNPYPLTARRPIASELVEGRTTELQRHAI